MESWGRTINSRIYWWAQARTCGDVLVVGLIPDEEIVKVKGPPVCNDEERYAQLLSN